jgi:hypothetical protein
MSYKSTDRKFNKIRIIHNANNKFSKNKKETKL